MNINKKIAEVKAKLKKITKHFPYTKEQINYLVIAYMSMIMLDESIEDVLDMTLANDFCLFTDLSVDEAYELYISSDNTGAKYKGCYGVYEGYYYDNEGNLSYVPYIIISMNCQDLVDFFDTLTHELKHAVNEIINKGDKNGFYSGISYIDNKKKIYNEGLDEAFNSFLVEIYLQNIAYLSYMDVEDSTIRRILKSFYISDSYVYSYSYLINSIMPLYKSRELFWGLYNAALYKDMEGLNRSISKIFENKITPKEFIESFDRKLNAKKLMSKANQQVISEGFSHPKR